MGGCRVHSKCPPPDTSHWEISANRDKRGKEKRENGEKKERGKLKIEGGKIT